MNVLFLITKSEIGGAQRFVQEQIVVLTNNGHKAYLVTNKVGWLTNSVSDKVIKFAVHENIESKFSPSFFWFLHQFIITNKIDLVVCNSANAGLYGRIAAFCSSARSTYVSHGWSSIYNGGRFSFVLNLIERLLGWIGDSVLCISENDFILAHKKIGISKRKLFVIPNSILPNGRLSITERKDRINLLMVSRLDHPKRPALLIQAIQKIGKKIDLTIVGAGSQYPELISLLTSEDDNIHLIGEIPAFNDFSDFDAFALISLSEGLPISALEAMSSGLALVLSNVGGCPSLINDNGVLVENNVDAIVDGLSKLIKNIKQYKLNSQKFFNEKFNLQNNASKYISYYNSILDQE